MKQRMIVVIFSLVIGLLAMVATVAHIGILGDPGGEPPPITSTISFNGITLTVKIDKGNDRFEVDGSFSLITNDTIINPVTVTLIIGDEAGSVTVIADIN